MLPRIVRAAAGRRLLSTYPTAPERLSSLRAMIANPPGGDVVRVLEVHSGLCGLIAETARGPNGEAFDATWSSSLTSSAIKGKPDIETVDTSARIGQVEDVLEVSTKPMIYDGDTGGLPEIFHFTVRSLERLGVSACIIEDKTGLKQNSLFGTDRKQQLEDIDSFCAKISAGKAAQVTDDFMVIARMESLIAGYGTLQRTTEIKFFFRRLRSLHVSAIARSLFVLVSVLYVLGFFAGEDEAIMRATCAIEAGADGVMIHSKEGSPDEVLSFLERYNRELGSDRKPIVAVPTTYNQITEAELADAGVSVCIYANHLLRASYPSMMGVAESILANGRSLEADEALMPVKTILTLIDDNTGS